MTRLPISAFIVCLNEEAYIGSCIESLSLCEEIVIVDSGSTDGTLELIRTYEQRGWPIRVFSRAWPGYAAQKQYALDQCSKDWCLNIDADERLDEELRNSLPHLVAVSSDSVGWRIPRRPYLIGFGYTPRNVKERSNLRLIRRGKGAYDLSRTVHEGIVPDGAVKCCNSGSLLHYRPLLLDEQILKENKYSTLKADHHMADGKTSQTWKLVLNPPIYFLRLYLRNGLWRCGAAGFIEAMTGAIYAFLTQAKISQRDAIKRRTNIDPSGTQIGENR
ncbi:glycosyltransferase family 2 protein [Patescibacteria group bacterium]|nr:glycosyltransferase family 2 protein [Patescibacteria group bacterium]